ncbi:MAG: rod shape-determining protein RodA [Candidatus Magasanikbacteria bacterium]|nr:rod shape-determining protein RodA [Candidatus Magasanikbacteria bacterium]
MFYRKFSKLTEVYDWWLIAAVFLLSLFSLAALYSVGLGRPDTEFIDFKKQLVFVCLGLGVMLFVGRFNFSFFRIYTKPFYFFCLLLLLGVLIFGRVIHGTRGWFVIGNFSFQPVELAKVAVILILALFASQKARSFKTWGFFAGTIFLVALPAVLTMMQPDLGSTLIIGAIWLMTILTAGIKKRYLLGLLVIFLLGFVAAWFFLFKDYQKDRFLTFIDPAHDAYGGGYNVIQSVIAVGSGQFFGRGLGFGSQSQLRFLPENQTDFIFAVIGEELGFVGVTFILILYSILFYRLLLIALKASDDFVLFSALGILALFFAHFLINVGMNIGIMPVTGITLPFLSAGGSSLVVDFLLIGFAESLNRAR